MARWAMVDTASGFVVNVIEWDGNAANFAPPAEITMVEDTEAKAGPGFKWDGTSFAPPPSPEPGPIRTY